MVELDDAATVAAAVAAWRSTAAVPTVERCEFLAEATELLVTTSQKDLPRGSARRSLHSFARSPSGEWAGHGFPAELSAETSLVVPSPSGALLARAVRVTAAAGAPAGRECLFPAPTDGAPALGTHTRVDITDRGGGLVATITLPSVVYSDGWFEGYIHMRKPSAPSHFSKMFKPIMLPRQARDKHREHSKQ